LRPWLQQRRRATSDPTASRTIRHGSLPLVFGAVSGRFGALSEAKRVAEEEGEETDQGHPCRIEIHPRRLDNRSNAKLILKQKDRRALRAIGRRFPKSGEAIYLLFGQYRAPTCKRGEAG